MPTLEAICEEYFCRTEIQQVFDPSTGTRQSEVIAGDLYFSDCCFVRDEIRFLNHGRLIFGPSGEQREQHCREYFVICRKLVVVGGHKPGALNPCGPDDPGQMYTANNVITWQDRLHAANTGNPLPKADDGQSHNRNVWQNLGQGNNGMDGGNGDNGQKGNRGDDADDALNFTLIALEVEIGVGDHLTIDFDGENGGQGGVGQKGGKGGNGMGGRSGQSDTSWPGIGCDRQPGSGGDGGKGGDGGEGGDGGDGGDAGDITIYSTADNLSGTGPFLSGHFTYVNDGGTGGEGGLGGIGGNGGLGGNPGFKTSECDAANVGQNGDLGWPTLAGVASIKGGTGGHGAARSVTFEEVKEGTCVDLIPLPIKIDAGLHPAVYCRGFSTPAIGEGKIAGQNLAQVTAAEVSGLANITTTIKATSTDAQLDLRFDIAGNSGLGTGDLVLHRNFGPDEVLSNAIEVRRFEVVSVTPNSGARSQAVNVQITGQCFDPSAVIQQVLVSGLGVTAINVIVTNEQTIDCVFDIGPLAPLGARNVTVKTGTRQHTLVDGFTVTA